MHRHRKTVDLKCQRQLEINQIAQRTFCAAGKENVRIKAGAGMEIYMNIMSLTAVELGKRIKAKEISVEEAVTAALDAIEKKEKLVNSFVTVDREGALKRAKEVQKQIDDGTLTGPLAGVPVAIKDNMCTKDLLTTCSSKILYNFIPTYTAEAVLNLEKAGAVILGKTNMDEFAMGSTTETSAYGETKIHGTQSMCRAVLRVVPVQRLRQRNVSLHLDQIPAVPSVSRVPSAA